MAVVLPGERDVGAEPTETRCRYLVGKRRNRGSRDHALGWTEAPRHVPTVLDVRGARGVGSLARGMAMRPSGDAPIRVYLIDDHPVVSSGLALTLEGEADIVLVGDATTAAEGLAGAV